MTCTVDDRTQVRRAAETIRETAPTIAVDVLPPAKSQYDEWTLDAVIEGQGIEPAVLRELAIAGLTLRPTPAQGTHQHVVATA